MRVGTRACAARTEMRALGGIPHDAIVTAQAGRSRPAERFGLPFADTIPGTRFVFVPDSGHDPQEEQPPYVARVLTHSVNENTG